MPAVSKMQFHKLRHMMERGEISKAKFYEMTKGTKLSKLPLRKKAKGKTGRKRRMSRGEAARRQARRK